MGASAEERELLTRTAKGDEQAFTTLFRRHHQSIYRFAYLMTGAAATADDITQEVFIVLMREAHLINPDRGTLVAYLQGVARNHVLRHLRHNQRYIALDHEPAESNADRCLDSARVLNGHQVGGRPRFVMVRVPHPGRRHERTARFPVHSRRVLDLATRVEPAP